MKFYGIFHRSKYFSFFFFSFFYHFVTRRNVSFNNNSTHNSLNKIYKYLYLINNVLTVSSLQACFPRKKCVSRSQLVKESEATKWLLTEMKIKIIFFHWYVIFLFFFYIYIYINADNSNDRWIAAKYSGISIHSISAYR